MFIAELNWPLVSHMSDVFMEVWIAVHTELQGLYIKEILVSMLF